MPERPVVFMKPSTALNHDGQPIRLPACSTQPEVDYEVELAVVIGREGRNIPEARRWITCSATPWPTMSPPAGGRKRAAAGNGCAARGLTRSRRSARCCVTADEIPDPQQLTLRTTLNGHVMQQATTADMLFPVKHSSLFSVRTRPCCRER